MTLKVSEIQPFARGGNRLCFVHPEDTGRCIKVRRPDFTLEDLRRKKGFPKNLKPLSSFDDNAEEYKVMTALHKRLGEPLYQLVSRCFGFEETDMGKGLVSELIRDEAGSVSHTLKQVIWDEGYTEECQRAVGEFIAGWNALGVPSRDLLVHNIVVQRCLDGSIQRLVVIDGLGSSSILPDFLFPQSYFIKKAHRKTENLRERINILLAARAKGEFPGTHGLLMHEGIQTGK
ncbi:YrbL family protein [Litoribrevibacter euphylliae]|uniref:YrbL family protein n=1 Tax=Litoribrevibacter euphylliae TaxID=1834034 RepID=A0ABV7HLS5_9GAMM